MPDKPVQGFKSCFHVAQSLFPSTMCSAFVEIIALLDDQAVSLDGTAVYEVAYDVSFPKLNIIIFKVQILE